MSEQDVLTGYPTMVQSPMDVDFKLFTKDLERRSANKEHLVKWIHENFRDKVDFGSIVFGKKVSTPTLLKPGSEKIINLLGLTATFPSLKDYENKIIRGEEVDNILIKCVLINNKGELIAEGAGGRSVNKERGDLNKALKMALKSAQIDATLRVAGLSDMYTQDIEDMPELFNGHDAELVWSDKTRLLFPPFGKHKQGGDDEMAWADVDVSYLVFFIEKGEKEDIKLFCKAEKDFREKESRTAQTKQDEIENGSGSDPRDDIQLNSTELRPNTMATIEKMKVHDNVSITYANLVNKWLYNKTKIPLEMDGQKVIDKMVAEFNVPLPSNDDSDDLFSPLNTEEKEEPETVILDPVLYDGTVKGMIECAMANWKMPQTIAVTTLNSSIPKKIMGKGKTIDSFPAGKCEEVIKGIIDGSITPF